MATDIGAHREMSTLRHRRPRGRAVLALAHHGPAWVADEAAPLPNHSRQGAHFGGGIPTAVMRLLANGANSPSPVVMLPGAYQVDEVFEVGAADGPAMAGP